MLELPSSDLRKLIILEEDEQYLAALKVVYLAPYTVASWLTYLAS